MAGLKSCATHGRTKVLRHTVGLLRRRDERTKVLRHAAETASVNRIDVGSYLNDAGCSFRQASYRMRSVFTGFRFSPSLIPFG